MFLEAGQVSFNKSIYVIEREGFGLGLGLRFIIHVDDSFLIAKNPPKVHVQCMFGLRNSILVGSMRFASRGECKVLRGMIRVAFRETPCTTV